MTSSSVDPTPRSSGGRQRVAVVTGASGGIGAAIVNRLASEGHCVVAVGRRPRELDQLAESVTRSGAAGRVEPVVLELTDKAAPERLAEIVGASIGGVDVLVHAAAIHHLATVAETDADDLRQLLITNVEVPFGVTRALVPFLTLARGIVVFVNSSVGIRAASGVTAYAASKHALRALADGLRDEVNADGIRVLSLYLGRTATPMQESIHAAQGRHYEPDLLIQPEDVAAVISAAIALPDRAELTDIHLRPARPPR